MQKEDIDTDTNVKHEGRESVTSLERITSLSAGRQS